MTKKEYRAQFVFEDESEMINDLDTLALAKNLSTINDTRGKQGKQYRLVDILIITIYAVLCGWNDFDNIQDFGFIYKDYFKDLLGMKKDMPSVNTYKKIFSLIDPKLLLHALQEYLKNYCLNKTGMHIAIDGKAIRAATKKSKKGNVPYILNAYLCELGIVTYQYKIDEKTNEKRDIPNMLKDMDITGLMVTIDAIGTTTEIVKIIKEKKADFCLSVKDNQKTLKEEIIDEFRLADERLIITKTVVNKGHGRIETRKYSILKKEEFYFNESCFKDNVKVIGKIETTREIIDVNNTKTTDIHYYIVSKDITIDEFVSYTRNHWGIENNLHYILDVFFKEDRSTVREEIAMQNFSFIRKTVLNLMKIDKEYNGLTTAKKMKRYQYDFKNIERLLFNYFPELSEEELDNIIKNKRNRANGK